MEKNRVIKRLEAEEEEGNRKRSKLPVEDRDYNYYLLWANEQWKEEHGPYGFQFVIDSLTWGWGDYQNVAQDGQILVRSKATGEEVAVLTSDEGLYYWESHCRREKEKKVEMIEQEHDGMEIVEPVETPLEFRADATGVVNSMTRIGGQEVKKVKASEVDFHGDFSDMNDEQQDAIINPAHYKLIPPEAYEKFPEGLEYMDLMEYILSHHKGVEAHLLGQIFKYACRLGKKDADLQDAKKIEWYANRLVNAIKERS